MNQSTIHDTLIGSHRCLRYILVMTRFADETFLGHLSKDYLPFIEAIPEAIAELSETELKSLVRPKPMDYALKTSFWREYNKAEACGGVISFRDVYGGISTPNYFKSHILSNNYRLAWLCRPTQIYEKEVEALLNRGTERLWELMEMDMYKDDGTLDVKKGYLVLDVIKMVEQRAKGLAVQRVQSVNVNLEGGRSVQQIPSTAEEIDQRIKELETELVKLPPKQEYIDVSPSEEGILEASGDEEEAAGDVAPSVWTEQIQVAD